MFGFYKSIRLCPLNDSSFINDNHRVTQKSFESSTILFSCNGACSSDRVTHSVPRYRLSLVAEICSPKQNCGRIKNIYISITKSLSTSDYVHPTNQSTRLCTFDTFIVAVTSRGVRSAISSWPVFH